MKPPIQNFFEHGKIPPQSLDMEEAVLAAIMIEKSAMTTIAAEFSPEIFYKDTHVKIARAIRDLYNANKEIAIDLLTVTEQLKKNGHLDDVGGPFAIAQLTNKVGSAANVEHHIRILLEKYMARQLIAQGSTQISAAYNDETDIFELLDQSRKEFVRIEQISVTGRVETTESMADEALERFEANIQGIPSSHSAINLNIGGWIRGHLVVVAARPGMGKTAFHVSELAHLCSKGVKCMSVNLEMLKLQFFLRMAGNIGRVPNYKIKHKTWHPSERENFYNAWAEIRCMKNLHLDFEAGQKMSMLASKIRKVKFEHGLDVVFVDHLQFIASDAPGQTRDLEIGAITRALKKVAKDEDVCIVLFSHINRAVEKTSDKRPTLADLRESGNIENDADVVIFFVRPEYYFEKNADGTTKYSCPEEEAFKNVIQVFCDKHRDGPTFKTEWECHLSVNTFKDIINEMPAPAATQAKLELDDTPF